MIGYMLNAVLPLRAGEIARVYVVARRPGQGFWTVLATLVVERVLDSLAIVLVLATLILALPVEVPAIFEWAALVLLAVDVVAVGCLAFLALTPARCRRIVERLTARWPTFQRRACRALETFGRGLEGIRAVRHLVPLLAWTAVVWAIPAVAAWTVLRAVHLELPFAAAWMVLAFVGLGISVPAAPGYVGVFHFAAAEAVKLFGVAPSAAVGYAVVFHASQILPQIAVGWLFLLREHLTVAEAARARPVPPPGDREP
jgi:glycosyltransferase 2 family protein